MSQAVSTENQEEYEDDFEKDLDWLISEEEGQTEDQGPDYEEIESEIDKELLEEDKDERGRKEKEKKKKSQKAGKGKKASKELEVMEEEERWPSPMEPLECDLEGDVPPTAPPPPLAPDDEEVDEEKKYILDKIQQANRELQDQEAPDASRHIRLHFKDNLVDLVVPPLEYERGGTPAGAKAEGRERSSGAERANGTEAENEVSGKLSELKISPRQGGAAGGGGPIRAKAEAEGSSQAGHGGGKEGRVLVEKDGKFELVSLKEMESQGLLPPLANHPTETSFSSPRPQEPMLSPNNKTPAFSSSASPQQGVPAPRPPAKPRNRPNSASHGQRDGHRRSANRRVQSATGAPCQATYTLSPQQKELLQRSQERKERLAKEAEQKKREEEEEKRQENEVAFRAWLIRKREQFQEERRIHRAQEMERMNSSKQRDASDPEVAFRSWLQRKQEQQQRDRQMEEMRRLEQEGGGIYLHNPVESDRAFRTWLKRKRAEKRAEQQAARERSRRLVLDERRARRTQDLLCAVNDMKPFRFSEHLAYRF